jgi:putative component of toxin-antitoxin plasmid stabilization module
MTWSVEFFAEDDGRQPAREWLESLETDKRAAAIAAIETMLTEFGLDICGTEHGKQLGGGLFEFRIRHDASVSRRKAGQQGSGKRSGTITLRIFCHAYGERIILLLGGYDKGAAPAPRRQSREIERARKRLRSFKLRLEREKIGKKRRG